MVTDSKVPADWSVGHVMVMICREIDLHCVLSRGVKVNEG